MTYSYSCSSCKLKWDESLTIDNRNIPLEKPCGRCGNVGGVFRDLSASPRISYDGKCVTSRISSGFNDLLSKVKSSSGRRNTIQLK